MTILVGLRRLLNYFVKGTKCYFHCSQKETLNSLKVWLSSYACAQVYGVFGGLTVNEDFESIIAVERIPEFQKVFIENCQSLSSLTCCLVLCFQSPRLIRLFLTRFSAVLSYIILFFVVGKGGKELC